MWWGVRKAVGSLSLSARRAWIEIRIARFMRRLTVVALRKESVDRNIRDLLSCCGVFKSLSARRAWIEIAARRDCNHNGRVALRKESVDRNTACRICGQHVIVALRKESVDRNRLGKISFQVPGSLSARRAWIEILARHRAERQKSSLSARRAWIEIWPVAILLISVKSRSPQGERG